MKKVNDVLGIVTLCILIATFVITLIQKEYVLSLYAFTATWFCLDNILLKNQIAKLLHDWKDENEAKHSVMNMILNHAEKAIDELNNLGKMIVMLSDELEGIDPDNKVLNQIKRKIENGKD